MDNKSPLYAFLAAAGLTVSGSLVVAGGSLAVDSAVFHEILERAGGRASARIVFFPTNRCPHALHAVPVP